MRRFHIPTMSALLAFEAAARHESFSLAAKELFITESAVSRQISGLESYLGLNLFLRSKQRVLLTPVGRTYSVQVREALESLNRSTLNTIAHQGEGVIELAVLPTIATEWLIPRLPDFQRRHPGVRINMSSETRTFRFDETHYEAALHYGQPDWAGTHADFLLADTVIPVCKKGALEQPINDPRELLKHPLLHSTGRPSDWPRWFSQFGIEGTAPSVGTRYDLVTMLMAAVGSGLGIALLPAFMVRSHMERYDLEIAFDVSMENDSSFYLVYPTNVAQSNLFLSFRDWMIEQAQGAD